jgi:hypothetical protein
MRDAHTLPVLKRGWPETVKIGVSNNPTIITDDTRFKEFMVTPLDSGSYLNALRSVRNLLMQGVPEWKDNRYVYLKKMDQDGQAGSMRGQESIKSIAVKLEEDFLSIRANSKLESKAESVVVRGTWLWASTPPSIIEFLEKYLKAKFVSYYPTVWLHFVEAASRCLINPKSYRILFTAIYKRLLNPPARQRVFPIQCARAVWRVLLHRPDGQDGLDKDMAMMFLERAVDMVCHEVEVRNLKQRFFQSLLLFFVLLRYRKRDQGFLNPDDQFDKELLGRLYRYLDIAENWFVKYELHEI